MDTPNARAQDGEGGVTYGIVGGDTLKLRYEATVGENWIEFNPAKLKVELNGHPIKLCERAFLVRHSLSTFRVWTSTWRRWWRLKHLPSSGRKPMDDRLGRIRRAVAQAAGEWGDIEAQGEYECQLVTDDPEGNGDIELHVPVAIYENDPKVEWEHFRITVERFEGVTEHLAPEEPQ